MRKVLKTVVKKPAKKERETAVRDDADYSRVIEAIEQLMKAGKGTIRNKDLTIYGKLAKAAAEYEQRTYTIPSPKTLEGLLEWKMYELKLKQKGLAEKLHVSDAKLSLILAGKQKADVALLKSIHTELGIDGNTLLEAV